MNTERSECKDSRKANAVVMEERKMTRRKSRKLAVCGLSDIKVSVICVCMCTVHGPSRIGRLFPLSSGSIMHHTLCTRVQSLLTPSLLASSPPDWSDLSLSKSQTDPQELVAAVWRAQ